MSGMSLVLGPPGTGKTTRLLGEMEKYLRAGGNPERIGFVTFTKKAVAEAVGRTGRAEADLPYFRTLHSLCFRLCGLTSSLVIGPEGYAELGERLGLELTGKHERGQVEELPPGDRALALDGLARARLRPLKEAWEEHAADLDLDWELVDVVARGLKRYKGLNGLVDYTDMLERFLEKGVAPELDLLLVDEAQDLSPLQWRVVENLAVAAGKVLLAGDDDQAIYRWAGADVAEMARMAAERGPEVLRQSHRVPRDVHAVAQEVAGRISRRIPKEYLPRDAVGGVARVASLDDAGLAEGRWLILVRNRYLARPVADALLRDGLWFESFVEAPGRWASLRAAVVWEDLRRGRSVGLDEAVGAASLLANGTYSTVGMSLFKAGKKARRVVMADLKKELALTNDNMPWFEALAKVSREESEYLRAAARRGENLRQPPRITVETIHGAKGGESDHVAVLTDVSRRTWEGMNRDPDAETRVFYVAVTRARETLTLVQPETPYYFEM